MALLYDTGCAARYFHHASHAQYTFHYLFSTTSIHLEKQRKALDECNRFHQQGRATFKATHQRDPIARGRHSQPEVRA